MNIESFIASKKFPGNLVFAKLWGSRSHNCHKEDSDHDFSGVYVGDTVKFLGMRGIQDTFESNENEKPDFAFHEVGKFSKLLIVGNPSIVEMLFTDKFYYETYQWQILKKNRDKFLSKKAVKQYLGYAEGQLKRLKAGKCLHTKGSEFSEKWAYHAVRLLGDAELIVNGLHPVVWKEGQEHTYLMKIRNNEISKEQVEEEIQKRIDIVSAGLESCGLPEKGDEEFLDEWLINLRLENL